MPWGDRTGPAGQGPRTGRGLGYCNGYNQPGYVTSPGFGRGYGRGFGFGRGAWGWGRGAGYGWGRGWGWARWNWPAPPATSNEAPKTAGTVNEQELNDMRNELHSLRSAVDGLLSRLSALTGGKEKTSEEE
jgi:hypothetical protein